MKEAKIDVVPRIVLGSAAGSNGTLAGGSNALEALLTVLLSERLGEPAAALGERSAEAVAVRQRLHAALVHKGETSS